MIERMDHEYEKYYEKIDDHRLEIPPSEIFRRQIFVTYEDESIGVRLIPEIGVDNVMWASDYPHGDSTWPHSRQAIASSPLASLGDEIPGKSSETTRRPYTEWARRLVSGTRRNASCLAFRSISRSERPRRSNPIQ